MSSAVADEGEHPEGQDDLDAERGGVRRLDLGEAVEGEDGAGRDKDDDAGDDDGAELDAESGRQGPGNIRDTLYGGDEDDEVEEAPADPCGSGQGMKPSYDGEEYVGKVQFGSALSPGPLSVSLTSTGERPFL